MKVLKPLLLFPERGSPRKREASPPGWYRYRGQVMTETVEHVPVQPEFFMF